MLNMSCRRTDPEWVDIDCDQAIAYLSGLCEKNTINEENRTQNKKERRRH